MHLHDTYHFQLAAPQLDSFEFLSVVTSALWRPRFGSPLWDSVSEKRFDGHHSKVSGFNVLICSIDIRLTIAVTLKNE